MNYLRAYGGTGNLVARAFIAMMMIDPLIKQGEKISLSLLDLDNFTDGADTTDMQEVINFIAAYQNLHNMGLDFTATNELDVSQENLHSIRNMAYGINTNNQNSKKQFSVEETFIHNNEDVKKIFLSALTSDELTAENAQGAYGELARNAFIAVPIEKNGFNFDNGMSNSGNRIFYLGSTDGGTANTYIDPDVRALKDKVLYTNGNRNDVKAYAVRLLPYKTFDPGKDPVANRVYDQIVPQSAGVINNILHSNQNYYKRANGSKDYYFDGLFLVGSNVNSKANLDNTNVDPNKPAKDKQKHKSHAVELAAAMTVIDAINNDANWTLANNQDAVYTYDLVTDANGQKNFFSTYSWQKNVEKYGDISIDIISNVKTFIRLYAIVKLNILHDLNIEYSMAENDDKSKVKYIKNLLSNQGSLFGKEDRIKSDNISTTITILKTFCDNAKYFVKFIYDVQTCNKKFSNLFFDDEFLKNLIDPEPTPGKIMAFDWENNKTVKANANDYSGCDKLYFYKVDYKNFQELYNEDDLSETAKEFLKYLYWNKL